MQQGISQCLDELIDRLNACRPSLDDLDLDVIETPYFDLTRVKGKGRNVDNHMNGYIGSCLGLVAEEYVRLWLQCCEGVQEPLIELPPNGFDFRDRVLFSQEDDKGDKKRRKRAEFDGLFSYVPYSTGRRVDAIVEVKYRRQHGFAANPGAKDAPITRKLQAAQIVFGQRPSALLVAFPISRASQSVVRDIEAAYPQVRCLDVGYDRNKVHLLAEVLYLKTLATALQEANDSGTKAA